MKKFLNQYYKIIEQYKSGEFGQDNLTLGEILNRAGVPELFDKMTLSELRDLADNVSGVLKAMVKGIYNRRKYTIQKMSHLEKELSSYHISQYCNDDELLLPILKDNLRLDVQYMGNDELPADVEALLEPSTDNRYLGVIKILADRTTKFPYMHEIMHYIRDVGVGNKVNRVYTRKVTGKTDSEEEQEINYLTAAAVMPISKVKEDLPGFEQTDSSSEDIFIDEMVKKYGQEYETVRRRFIEVRSISDFKLSTMS